MSEKEFTVLKDGQLAIATVVQTGTIIPEEGKDPARYTTALVQTDDGAQLCQKVFNLGEGGGGGGADTSLSNLTATGKATVAHLATMSNTVTKLTLVNEDIYTAPADGEFYMWGAGGGVGGGWLCMANNNETPSNSDIVAFEAGDGNLFTVTLKVKKGDKVRATLFGNGFFNTGEFSGMGFYFRYAVGNE